MGEQQLIITVPFLAILYSISRWDFLREKMPAGEKKSFTIGLPFRRKLLLDIELFCRY
jgi:hypothetical protein